MRAVSRRLIPSLLAFWFLLPLVTVVIWAFADEWRYPDSLPSQWGVRGWRAAFDQGAADAIAHSLLLSAVVGAVATSLGVMTAWWMTCVPSWLRQLVAVIALLPVVLPPFALVLGLNTIVLRAQIPPVPAVAATLVVLALPYAIFVMLTTFHLYDRGYDDDARTLGAAARHVWWRVRLPIVTPGLITAWFLSFIVGWSDYVVTLIIGAGQLVTAPLLVASQSSGTGNGPVVAALIVMTVAPPVLLAGIVWKLRTRAVVFR